MARSQGYAASSKSITASTTAIFSGNDLPLSVPGQTVVGLIVEHSGGSQNDASDVTRVKVKAGGSTIVDVTYAYLRQIIEHYSGQDPGAAATRWFIPLNRLGVDDPDFQDEAAAPIGAPLQLEIQLGASVAGSATLLVGWLLSDIPPKYFPMVIANPTNFAASATNASVQLSERGLIQAFMFPTPASNPPTRHKLVLQGITRVEGSEAMLQAREEMQGENSVGTIALIDLDGAQQAAAIGTSKLECDTPASYSSAVEYGYLALRVQGG